MNTVLNRFREIYERLTQDMPLFIKSGLESFISLFLFTLVLFFIFLLLQCAKNLVFKNGRNILPYGACLTALAVLFYFSFMPAPCISAEQAPKIARIKVQSLQDGTPKGERYMFISERERLSDMLFALPMTRSITPQPKQKNGEDGFIVTVTYENGAQTQINIEQGAAYAQPVPFTGRILRSVKRSEEISRYLTGLKI